MKIFAPSYPDLNRISNLDVFTLVIWLGCLSVGILGLAFPYAMPLPKPATPVKVEMLNVELNHQSQSAQTPPSKTFATQPDALVQPDIPQPVPVAEPSPAITFALPVAGPVRVVDIRHAVSSKAPVAKAVGLPAPLTLTFGQGEGRQPAPEYPARARNEGQEGNVTIRFTVAADGQVVTTEVMSASPWSLLNDSALLAVRERWRFSAGAIRVYDVVIHFELNDYETHAG